MINLRRQKKIEGGEKHWRKRTQNKIVEIISNTPAIVTHTNALTCQVKQFVRLEKNEEPEVPAHYLNTLK